LHTFEMMALVLIFGITLKEVSNWFGPGPGHNKSLWRSG
jgi:hypothetical protein